MARFGALAVPRTAFRVCRLSIIAPVSAVSRKS